VTRIKDTDDLCVIDENQFFIRGVWEIPRSDENGIFGWGVWAQVSRTDFESILKLWDDDATAVVMAGRLGVEPPGFSGGLGHPVTIRLRDGKTRPQIIMKPSDSEIYSAQRDGIDFNRWHEVVSKFVPWAVND